MDYADGTVRRLLQFPESRVKERVIHRDREREIPKAKFRLSKNFEEVMETFYYYHYYYCVF